MSLKICFLLETNNHSFVSSSLHLFPKCRPHNSRARKGQLVCRAKTWFSFLVYAVFLPFSFFTVKDIFLFILHYLIRNTSYYIAVNIEKMLWDHQRIYNTKYYLSRQKAKLKRWEVTTFNVLNFDHKIVILCYWCFMLFEWKITNPDMLIAEKSQEASYNTQ